jgi:Holliday junction resolvase-like predicted endonuclease
MHPELLAKAVSGIRCHDTINIDEFMVNSAISGKTVANQVLHYMRIRGVGYLSKGKITFLPSDRLKAALMALQIGGDIERVSTALTWRDFEALAVEVLHKFGYTTQTNVRLRKPRCEIDVIGMDSTRAVVIDCKHWKRSNVSLISSYAKKQLARAELLLQKRSKTITSAIPILVTLHHERVRFINKVPIVPITMLNSFLSELDLNSSLIELVCHD